MKVLLWLLGIVTVVVAVGPFLVPIPPLPGTVAPRALAAPASRFARVAGIDVHFRDEGRGDPVFFLLHGFGASVFTWRAIEAPLAAHSRVVSYDRPAFGLTERPLTWSGENPYGDAAQVVIATALLDRLGIARVVLIGHSAGAGVAARLALAQPSRITGLVLVAPAIGGGVPAWTRLALRLPQVDRLGPLLVRSISDRGDQIIRQSWHDPTRVTADVLAGYRQPLEVDDWDRGLWEFVKAPRTSGLAARLPEIGAPTLIVTGDDDRIVPTAGSIDVAEQLDGARLAVLERCGHLPHEECPDEFLRVVRDFVASITRLHAVPDATALRSPLDPRPAS